MAISTAVHPHVRETGTGVPVVCLHSSAASSTQWRPFMERLGDRYRILAVDLYGSGKSPFWPGHRPLTLADEVALLEPVLDGLGERFHLVGHSYGGAVALRAALAFPDRLRSLVVFEPVLFALLTGDDPQQPAAREIAAVRDDTTAAVDRGDLDGAARRFVDYWMGGAAWSTTPPARRAAIAAALPAVKHEWQAIFAEPARLSAFSQIDVLTLCLTGSNSPVSSRAVARLLAKALPRLTEIEIEGVGHMGPVTHPDLINAEIERYLAGISLHAAS